jgi:hypothetical protein
MFKAIIIACVIGSPDNCMQISDTYGPYPLEGRCRTRLEEMQYKLKGVWEEYNMPFEVRQTSCTVVVGEAT